jgi:hypothetical protein
MRPSTRALTLALAATLALPLFADEPPKTAATAAAAQPAATTADAAAPAAPAQEDSPLVQAMKRANRRGRKPAIVITNETLKSSKGGHMSTSTSAQPPINVPPPEATPAEVEAQKVEAEKELEAKRVRQLATEAKLKKDAEDKKLRAARAAESAESEGFEGSYDDAEDLAGPDPDAPPPQR